MFTWTIGLSAPHPPYRPIWSSECCSISAGWTISASLICHPASSSISSVCHSVCAPTSWHPCPKWGAKSRTRWITGDCTPLRHRQGSPQTFGHVDLYGHPSAKRSVLPLPNPVMGIRGLVSGDRVLAWQDFNDPNHSQSGGLGVLPCSAGRGSHWVPQRQRPLSRQQESQHVNLLMMEAVLLSVAVSLPQHKSHVVCLMCDNVVVVSYIINEGGTKSFRLTYLRIPFLKLTTGRASGLCQFTFQVHATSRQMLSHMWARPFQQNGWFLHPVFSSWGTPVIDLSATFANRKLPVLASPFLDQRAKHVDAMPVPWSGMGMVYALPPFKMLPAVLNKIHSSHDLSVIKSPQDTGGDFMFLYRFVRRRRRPQILVHAITFEQLLGFLSFLAQLLALTCRLPDYIFVDFRRDLDLDFSRSNMEFAISQPKMVRLPRNEKQT